MNDEQCILVVRAAYCVFLFGHPFLVTASRPVMRMINIAFYSTINGNKAIFREIIHFLKYKLFISAGIFVELKQESDKRILVNSFVLVLLFLFEIRTPFLSYFWHTYFITLYYILTYNIVLVCSTAIDDIFKWYLFFLVFIATTN